MVHVGTESVMDGRRLAEHAASIKACVDPFESPHIAVVTVTVTAHDLARGIIGNAPIITITRNATAHSCIVDTC